MRTENDQKELTAYIETFIVDLRGICPMGLYSRIRMGVLCKTVRRNEDYYGII